MNKYLVIIIGQNYVHPMTIMGDIGLLVQRITDESNKCTYIYCLYSYNEKYDCYMPYGTLYRGYFTDAHSNQIDGVRVCR